MMNHMSPVEMEAAVHGQLLFPQDRPFSPKMQTVL